jgi:hypothetical protein
MRNFKALCHFSIYTVALCLLLFATSPLRAQFVPMSTATFDENGNGSLDSNLGGISNPHLASAMAPDPGPGGLSSALTYTLLPPLFATFMNGGDLFIFDTGSPLVLSDVIRFNPGLEGIVSPTVVFYSLGPGTDLADTGFPTQISSNNFAIAENPNGSTTYTPKLGQPGYSNDLNITYVFNSPEAVPEPAIAGLFAIGAVIVTAFRRKR